MTRSDYTPPTFVDVPNPASPPAGAVALDAAHLNALALAVGNSVRQSVVDVRDYGAKGNGTTDDTSALQAAVNAVLSGGTVYFPPGTYRTTNAVTVSAALSRVTLAGNGATIKFGSAPSGAVMLYLNAPDSTVQGLRFDGSSITDSTGIRPGASGQRIVGNRFLDFVAGGVYIPTGGAVTDLRIADNGFTGAGYSVLFHDASTASRVAIVGNTFRGTGGGDAIEVNTPAGGATDITIANNTIAGYDSTSLGIGLANVTGATVSGNVIRDGGNNGIHIEDRSNLITVTGNRVFGRSAGCGISVQVGAGTIAPSNVTITGNTISGCAYNGIELGGGVSVRAVTITGNIVRGNGTAGSVTYGIDLGYQGVGHVVVGNEISNTLGAAQASGIRWQEGTEYLISGNRITDTQATKTQQYGIKVNGTQTNVLVVGNMLVGNGTAPFDESQMSATNTNYVKVNNLP